MNIKENGTKQNRYEYLDVAKAFGIYLVILGHLVIFNYKTFRFIFAFHMPLFFVISGFILAGENFLDWKPFIIKIVKHYLVPYAAIFLISILQCILLPLPNHGFRELFSFNGLQRVYEGYPSFSYFGSSWFLLAMFWSQLIFHFILWIYLKGKKELTIMLWLVVIALAFFSKETFAYVPLFKRLPLRIDSALMAVLFIGTGYLIKKIIDKENNIINKCKMLIRKKYILFFLSVICALIVYYSSVEHNTYANMSELIYATEWRYYIGAVLGSIMVISLSKIFEKVFFFLTLGKQTLIIFLVHEIVLIIVIKIYNNIFSRSIIQGDIPFGWECVIISIIILLISWLVSLVYLKINKVISSLIGNKKLRKKEII